MSTAAAVANPLADPPLLKLVIYGRDSCGMCSSTKERFTAAG